MDRAEKKSSDGGSRSVQTPEKSWNVAALNVVDCGAVGNGETSSTAAIQTAIDRCGESGGGTVIIPPGKFVSATLWMRSNVTLHLTSGAYLLGDRNPQAYPIWFSQWEGPGVEKAHASLLSGEGLQNIAFTGRGIIDGRGERWWDLFNKKSLQHCRPGLFRMVDCQDVLIEGLTFNNSPRWTLTPTACDNLTITGVTIRNPHDSPNTDGINPDSCSNVHISNCHIDVGDDCITIKSGSEEDHRRTLRPAENLTVTNCTMLHGHGGIVIGSEMSGGVRNVAISNCVFRGTDRGIRLKARRGRGNAVEDVRVDNIVVDETICPIVVNLFYGCGAWDDSRVTEQTAQPVNAGTPQFRRLRFSNISARRIKYAATYILGLPEMFVEDIAINDSSFYLDPDNTLGGSPAMAPGIPDLCRAGLVVRNARNVKLRQIDVYDQLGPAITVENSQDVLVRDLHASSSNGTPLVQYDGEEVTIPENGDGSSDAVVIAERDQKPAPRHPYVARSSSVRNAVAISDIGLPSPK